MVLDCIAFNVVMMFGKVKYHNLGIGESHRLVRHGGQASYLFSRQASLACLMQTIAIEFILMK
jgi:hypothetical protein